MTISSANGQPTRHPHIVLYSHDTVGIGHVRRNLLIAQQLAHAPLCAEVLLISGAREAAAFEIPPRVDCLSLPSLYKDRHGSYRPRRLSISLDELIQLRATTIRSAIEAFQPDVVIVDKVPHGVLGELDLTLENCQQKRPHWILGLRDILDDPKTVRQEWRDDDNERLIEEAYDAVWVYGDQSVYDPVREYGFSPGVAEKVRFVGYLDQRSRLDIQSPEELDLLADLGLPSGKLLLCLVGGGQDGEEVADAFTRMELPPDYNGVLVTGPFMPTNVQQRLHQRAALNDRMRVLDFIAEPDLLVAAADRIITMGGYNSVCSAISFRKPALVVPRIYPRREQAIRAERLQELGLVDVLPWDEVSAARMSHWLADDTATPCAYEATNTIDLRGLERLPILLQEVLDDARHGPDRRHRRKEIRNVAR